eukprot:CAMPEP_0115268982 /NCGR_PEP_ID=MMETSP0270-20121206/52798_1 /TAXON_ID=71861 /ORGANISM="Scrippsiella trochoidea, Strain CCMP3099" /LENGTH=138 /DNA_ID=CAMNT_0002685195 /DNA_START=181 /DNA_END=597 /DNA_ORIENTATION=-
MAAQTPAETAMGVAQRSVDEAMDSVRGSMELMMERDARLHELQDKSSSLADTSNSFAQRARRLQWEYRWQYLRVRLFVCALAVWLALSYTFRHRLPIFFAVTGFVLSAAFLADHYVVRRLRSAEPDPQEAYAALHVQV